MCLDYRVETHHRCPNGTIITTTPTNEKYMTTNDSNNKSNNDSQTGSVIT